MSEDFQQNIRSWVSIDNQVKELNEQLRDLRTKKKELTSHLMELSEEEGYGDPIINITDGKLKFTEVNVSTPLSLKYVEQCLTDCIKDKSQVDKLMEYIKENRPVRKNREIKRLYNKE